ncbi:DUF5988 family protein [Streptomyces sp. HNA39]|uniref:DUF5988 family protein n=1 Tax=Streptomyces TaxID=1883 RepID=UPI00200F4622|nr:DUF5988 family protein [Streptomyces sp. HNA39]UQA36872.1 hypothetical protein KRR37_26480 [Streptomyces sp. HNA39]
MKVRPNAILQGGSTVPDEERVRFVEDTQDTFKLFLGNRYEHYRPTGTTRTHQDGSDLLVFEWMYRTYVAE